MGVLISEAVKGQRKKEKSNPGSKDGADAGRTATGSRFFNNRRAERPSEAEFRLITQQTLASLGIGDDDNDDDDTVREPVRLRRHEVAAMGRVRPGDDYTYRPPPLTLAHPYNPILTRQVRRFRGDPILEERQTNPWFLPITNDAAATAATDEGGNANGNENELPQRRRARNRRSADSWIDIYVNEFSWNRQQAEDYILAGSSSSARSNLRASNLNVEPRPANNRDQDLELENRIVFDRDADDGWFQRVYREHELERNLQLAALLSTTATEEPQEESQEFDMSDMMTRINDQGLQARRDITTRFVDALDEGRSLTEEEIREVLDANTLRPVSGQSNNPLSAGGNSHTSSTRRTRNPFANESQDLSQRLIEGLLANNMIQPVLENGPGAEENENNRFVFNGPLRRYSPSLPISRQTVSHLAETTSRAVNGASWSSYPQSMRYIERALRRLRGRRVSPDALTEVSLAIAGFQSAILRESESQRVRNSSGAADEGPATQAAIESLSLTQRLVLETTDIAAGIDSDQTMSTNNHGTALPQPEETNLVESAETLALLVVEEPEQPAVILRRSPRNRRRTRDIFEGRKEEPEI
ncbi:hypothetical protein WICPIJ_004081 [Wickerhamomyces pijperi]|uniref:Uncharacterized protein n=1 Tax=Wickerhamomyces pijperi TaxID=599730 RepID=A0A9P8TN93_WICPI|nr:hypothetical protein WICPIJ_004081 [Wickerhamomyces pijperi]